MNKNMQLGEAELSRRLNQDTDYEGLAKDYETLSRGEISVTYQTTQKLIWNNQ